VTLTASERVLRARQGGYARAAQHDVKELGRKSAQTLTQRLELEVDPHHVLPDGERRRRVEAARRAFYTSIAFRAVIARRKKANRRGATTAAIQEARLAAASG
jgi:hypothetical protein